MLDDVETKDKNEAVQSTLEVTVTYPTQEEKALEKNTELVKDYTIDAVIKVPAAFAGATLVIDGNEFQVPTAEKDATTIEFKLSEVFGLKAPLALSTATGSFTVTAKVPYESTTLKVGQYSIGFDSVVTKGAGEEADVRTLASTTTSVKVIGNPAVPTAIKAVLVAETAETLATKLGELKALESTLTYNVENGAAYLVALNKYTAAEDANATLATIQETLKTVDAAVALKNAIAAVEEKPSLTTLKVAELGWNSDSTKNELPLVAKNEGLYVAAIQEDVKATKDATEKGKDVPATYTTVEDIKAVVEEVNASLLGKVNAATKVAGAKTAVEALAAADEDVALYYNVLTDAQKITAAEAVVADKVGYAKAADLISVLKAIKDGEYKAPVTEESTPEVDGEKTDKIAPTIEAVTVNGTDAKFANNTITLNQNSVVTSIEITMSENVTLSKDAKINIATTNVTGLPEGLDLIGQYGTVALKENTDNILVITPDTNKGTAGYPGTVTFTLDGQVTDAVGNVFVGTIPTLNIVAPTLESK